jgi:hypothetical protein
VRVALAAPLVLSFVTAVAAAQVLAVEPTWRSVPGVPTAAPAVRGMLTGDGARLALSRVPIACGEPPVVTARLAGPRLAVVVRADGELACTGFASIHVSLPPAERARETLDVVVMRGRARLARATIDRTADMVVMEE